MRRLRRRLVQVNPEAAAAAAMLLPQPLVKQGVVAGYAAIGGEFDPRPAMRRFAEAGTRLALPAVRAPGAALEFLAWSEGDPLAPDALGVPAPLASAERLRPDLVLAPLLAFDRLGGRLGQGGGYFDRAIARLRAERPVLVIGLGFADQEIDDLPLEAHDARLDAILTESDFIDVARSTRRTP
jgi:5-formyltetrahydrofolate cyclo-ligase